MDRLRGEQPVANLVERFLNRGVERLGRVAREVDLHIWLLERGLDMGTETDRAGGTLAHKHATPLPRDDQLLLAQ